MLFGKWQRMFIYIEYNIEIRVEASDAVGSSYGIVILIVKLSRQNGWEQKNHLKPNPNSFIRGINDVLYVF